MARLPEDDNKGENAGINPEVKVRECYRNGEWNVKFRRNFGENELEEWSMFLTNTQGVRLNDEEDNVIWALDESKSFSTRSLYRFLSFQGAISPWLSTIWKVKVPLKIKIFLWQMRHGKLPGGVCLKGQGWKGSDRCAEL